MELEYPTIGERFPLQIDVTTAWNDDLKMTAYVGRSLDTGFAPLTSNSSQLRRVFPPVPSCVLSYFAPQRQGD